MNGSLQDLSAVRSGELFEIKGDKRRCPATAAIVMNIPFNFLKRGIGPAFNAFPAQR